MIPGYTTYSRNRKDRASGGIATSVAEEDSSNCVRVEEGNEDNEFIVTVHCHFETPINVINIYRHQECHMSREKIEKHWNEILDVVEKISARKISCHDW